MVAETFASGAFWSHSVFWVLVAFVLFFVIFGRKIWTTVAGLLDDRAEAIRTELAEASRLRREAEAMLRDASARREQALIESRAMLDGARAEAARVSARLKEEAETAARRRQQMAMDRIAAAEKAAVDGVRMIAADVATQAARIVLSRDLGADADGQLIDHAIAGLPSALAPRRAA